MIFRSEIDKKDFDSILVDSYNFYLKLFIHFFYYQLETVTNLLQGSSTGCDLLPCDNLVTRL